MKTSATPVGDGVPKIRRPCVRRILLAALAFNGLLCLTIPARAATLTWTNGSGTFGVAGNWSPNQAPVGGDAVSFTNPLSYTVTFGADALGMLTSYFNASSGTVTLDITGCTWGLTNNASGTSASAYGAFVVGQALNSTATVYLAGGTLAVTNSPASANLLVGGQGVGAFYVTNGTVFANQTKIGSTATGQGTLVLSGSGTRYTNSSTFHVGFATGGSGNSLVVSNNATLASSSAITVGNASSNNSATIAAGGVLSMVGGTLNLYIGNTSGGVGNTVTVDGGTITNATLDVGGNSGSTLGNSLVITNGGRFIGGGTLVAGRVGSSNSIIVAGAGGGGAPSWMDARGNSFFLGISAGTGNWMRVDNGGVVTNIVGQGFVLGGATASFGNFLIVTNGGRIDSLGGGLTVGRNSAASSNFVVVANGGFIGLGSSPVLYIGANASFSGTTGNYVRVDNGTISNVGSIYVGASNSLGNYLSIANGGRILGGSVASVGATNGNNNAILIQSRGLLEASTLSISASSTGNTISNVGGIYQFTTVTPNISPNGFGNITLTEGTISFRNTDQVDVKGSLGGNQLTNILFAGANTFRLDWATNTSFTAQDYTFGGNSPSNYVRLEMINGSTAWRQGPLTIAANGTMLVSNTSASILGYLTNSGVITVANATASYSNSVLLQANSSYTSRSATNAFNGGVVINPGAAFNIDSFSRVSGAVTNNGLMGVVAGATWRPGAGSLSVGSGALVVGSGGTLDLTNGAFSAGTTVTNSGTIRMVNGTVAWNGNVVNLGAYVSDPSTNTFNGNYTVGPTAYVSAASGDIYAFGRDFTMQSTNAAFNLSMAKVYFGTNGYGLTTTTTGHTLDVSGSGAWDIGVGYTNFSQVASDFAFGTLSIGTSNRLTLTGTKNGATTNALYVGLLDISWATTNSFAAVTNSLFLALNLPNINLYYDFYNPQNAWLNQYIPPTGYNLWGGGLLLPIPEPAPVLAMGAGLALLTFLRRRGA